MNEQNKIVVGTKVWFTCVGTTWGSGADKKKYAAVVVAIDRRRKNCFAIDAPGAIPKKAMDMKNKLVDLGDDIHFDAWRYSWELNIL